VWLAKDLFKPTLLFDLSLTTLQVEKLKYQQAFLNSVLSPTADKLVFSLIIDF
jgi:hypothetical protein